MRPFQIILLGIFAGFALLGLIFFMLFNGSSSETEKVYGQGVTVWGTLTRSAFEQTFADIIETDKDFQVVRYEQKDPRSFDYELLNAIAEGRSPDLIVLASESLVTHRQKLLSISYDTISQRRFRDSYVDGSEVFLLSDGVYAIPFAVDPLIMYWNRDLFSSNGLASAPRTWEELLGTVTPSLTRVSPSLEVSQSAVSFGEYANVRNAKEILSLLFLQSGTSIAEERDRNYSITLKQSAENGLPPAEAALSFYTQFSSPSAPQYSWNRSLPEDRLQFTGGRLGLYFGLGSEYAAIDGGNPNLNFDVAAVPQGSGATVSRGYGVFYGFAIPRSAQNPQGAYAVAEKLASGAVAASLAERLSLAPVSRSVLGGGTTDPLRQVLFSSALIARGWLDPNPEGSENVFRSMIEDVTSGRSRVSKSITDAIGKLQLLY